MTRTFVARGGAWARGAVCAATCVFPPLLGCAQGDMSVAGDEDGDAAAVPIPTDGPTGNQGGDDAAQPDDSGPEDAAPRPDSEATLQDAAPRPDSEATPQDDANGGDDAASIGDGSGVRCGSGALRCQGATPLCCETSDASDAQYACVAAGACAGYSIKCATGSDCAGGDSCCHYSSAIKCEPGCPTGSTLCDPTLSGSCPAGESCSVPLPLAGSPSPYLTCSP